MTEPDNSSDSPHSALAAAVSRGARGEGRPTPASYRSPTPSGQRIAAEGGSRYRREPEPGFLQLNRRSVMALCVVVAYIVLAETTGVIFFGIFPTLLGIRAFRRGEPLAPLALIAAGIAVVFAVAVLSHR